MKAWFWFILGKVQYRVWCSRKTPLELVLSVLKSLQNNTRLQVVLIALIVLPIGWGGLLEYRATWIAHTEMQMLHDGDPLVWHLPSDPNVVLYQVWDWDLKDFAKQDQHRE
jgi:hypothetical protein